MKLILIGLMGSGKTTIGRELSTKLVYKFIDMDDEIEKSEGMTIVEIFEKYGEKKFRSLETDLLKKIILQEDVIISTGGGIIKEKVNRELLKEQENVIFLDGNTSTLINHLCFECEKRPLLKNTNDLYKKVETLLKERYEKYKESSSIKIDINNKNINEVVSQILVYIR